MIFTIPGQPDFPVTYSSDQDGGGTWFGQEYVTVIRERYARSFDRCLEWCSGPGFIGFGILAHGLCHELCLMDHHAPVAQAIADTCQHNQLHDRVRFYCLDQVQNLPRHEVFDLVVANPPHFLTCPGDANYQRLAVDPDWRAHEEFYANIRDHLAPDAVVLLQENQAGSLAGPAEFAHMINRAGLRITGYFTSREHYDTRGPNQIYYIEIQR